MPLLDGPCSLSGSVVEGKDRSDSITGSRCVELTRVGSTVCPLEHLELGILDAELVLFQVFLSSPPFHVIYKG